MIAGEPVANAARPDPQVFHVYLDDAGWTNDQLQKEVELGAWFIFPADTGAVFNSDPDSLRPQMIRKTELKFARSEQASADPWTHDGEQLMTLAATQPF